MEEDDDGVSGFEIERPYYFDGPTYQEYKRDLNGSYIKHLVDRRNKKKKFYDTL